MSIWKQFRTSLIILGVFTLITGIIYPMVITGISQLFFNSQANGSFVTDNGTVIGSALIGQPFNNPGYFWGRLSDTTPDPYNASSSSGSNYSPSNPALEEKVKDRIRALKEADPGNTEPVPVDLITFSASGLDPHISIAAALYQVPRIARVRGLTQDVIIIELEKCTEDRDLGIFGEPRVNVLLLNVALDKLSK